MKRHTALWIAALAAAQLFAVACGLPDIVSERVGLGRVVGIAATPVALPDGTRAPAAAASESTASLVRKRGTLRAGLRFDAPPLASVDGQGDLIGFDVELAQEFARRWLGKPAAVEFVQVTSNSAPNRVANREVDLALGGLIRTKPAEAVADFSQSYFDDGEALLVRKGTAPEFRSMARQRVTWIDADTTLALRDAQNSNGITVTLSPADSYAAAVAGLKSGATDGVAGRLRRLRAVAQADPTLEVLTVFSREPVAVMLPPDDSEWADLVNGTLSAIVADGTYNRIHKKWFGVDGNPPRPLGDPVKVDITAMGDVRQRRDSIGKMRANGRVTVGFNAAADPLATLVKNQPAGFEIDLLREMAKRWFGKPEAATFSALPQDQLAAALRQGQIDVAVGGLPRSQVNEFNMDMSEPVFQSGVGFLVMQSARITETARLNGRSVGLVGITPTQIGALKAARGLSFNDVSFPDLPSAVAALRSKQVDAIAADRVTLFAYDRTTQDTSVLRDQLSEVPIAFGLPTNSSALRDLVNFTLQEMVQDGTFQTLYRKWFEEPARYTPQIWPGDASAKSILNP